jgi:hypothetical protein
MIVLLGLLLLAVEVIYTAFPRVSSERNDGVAVSRKDGVSFTINPKKR